MTREFKVLIKKYEHGYVASTLGFSGAVTGEGDTYEGALADVASAIHTAIDTFGEEVVDSEFPLLDAVVAEVRVSVDAKVSR